MSLKEIFVNNWHSRMSSDFHKPILMSFKHLPMEIMIISQGAAGGRIDSKH